MVARVLKSSLVSSGLVVALVACGHNAPGPRGPVPDSAVTPEAICSRIVELQSSRCPLVEGYDLTPDECVADYRRSFDDRGADAKKATLAAGHCLLDNPACDVATTCIDNLQGGANNGEPEQLRACSQTEVYAPVGVSQADFDQRKGANVSRFSDLTSTAAEPVEVCGLGAESEWLVVPTCNDGSHPFDSTSHAHAARVGNVGAGGRCGSIIDLFKVPCPEATYEVYIDGYVCPVPAGQPVP